MSDQELRRTPTHAADEFQGAVLGVETTMFIWAVAAMLVGLSLFVWLFYGRHFGFLEAAGWAALPLLIALAYLRLCHQGRPPGYTRDWLDSLFTHGHATPPQAGPSHPSDEYGTHP